MKPAEHGEDDADSGDEHRAEPTRPYGWMMRIVLTIATAF
jgi:hypothetical protein